MNQTIRYHAVVSDLHLGDGSPLDDFAYEDDFCAFLEHVHAEGTRRGGRAELVVNGDFIDFLQIVPLKLTTWRTAIEKLASVARAHAAAVRALGAFVAAGNVLRVLPGNHDIELAFGDVQEALTSIVSGGDSSAAQRVIFPNDAPLGPHFRGWQNGPFVHRLPGVYIEHGNQFDVFNYFDHGQFYVRGSEDEIHLPWGSHFVVDLFNEVERRYPFIDKIRPRSAAILILWLMDPDFVVQKLGALRALGPRMFQEMRKFARKTSTPAGGGARAESPLPAAPDTDFLALLGQNADALEVVYDNRAYLTGGELEGSRGRWSNKLSVAAAAVLRSALGRMTARPDRPAEPDEHTADAIELAKREGAEVVVLGHTHGLKDLRVGPIRYLNTGTWIGLLDLDHETWQKAPPEECAALIRRFQQPETFVPLRHLTFVEIHYPQDRLEANVRLFRDNHPITLDAL